MAWPNDGTSGVLHLARRDAYAEMRLVLNYEQA